MNGSVAMARGRRLGGVCVLVLSVLGVTPGFVRAEVQIKSIAIEGLPVRVFDHKRDKQALHHVPDGNVSAWREADGTVNLLLPHPVNYRMRGASLEQLESDPRHVYSSFEQAGEISEEAYNYHHWLMAPYTLDGKNIYALSHTEWYACLLVEDCRSRENKLGSWATTNNAFKSYDGGRTWSANGEKLVFNGASRWTGSQAFEQRTYRRALNITGFMVPSRIVREGEYFYTIGLEVYRDFDRLAPGQAQAPMVHNGFAILRTKDISSPGGWEVWSGGDDYKPAHIDNLQVFVPQDNGRPMRGAVPHVIYDLKAQVYVLFFTVRGERPGLYFATSRSLASPAWSEAEPVMGADALRLDPELPEVDSVCNIGLIPQNYPSVMDSDSPGRNFEFTDGDPWMFYIVNRARCGQPGENMKRDVYRVRMRFNYGTHPEREAPVRH